MAGIDELSRTMADDNEMTRYHLVQQLRSPLGVIPFVGAGMSVRFKFRGWGGILQEAAAVEGEDVAREVDGLLAAGAYEEAAELLRQRNEDGFQRRIEKEYGRPLEPSELRGGALALLPALASGPVITTNFDHVLESVFNEHGLPFTERILGPEPDRILKAIHRNSRVLIKMHGDSDDRKARTFTKDEYERNYGPERTGLGSLVWLMFTNRPLLFLGCSLDKDRTVKILQQIHAELGAVTHYAIVEAPAELAKFHARRKELADLGISPLWFPPRQYEEVEALLAGLVEEMSVKELAPAPPGQTRRRTSVEENPSPPTAGSALANHLKQVRRRYTEGRLMFFLGGGANLGTFGGGNAFYAKLAEEFGCPPLQWKDRSEIAEYIIDRHGRAPLWAAIREHYLRANAEPSLVLRILSRLPELRRGDGYRAVASQWIITTNQDCMLERAFEEVGEPFHLLYYQAHGEHEGRFIHVTTDGRVRVLERPENVRRLQPEAASVIVKLHGGVLHRPIPAISEAGVVARRDFARVAARIPESLPAVLRSALRERSVLFLGHMLRELDVEHLVRFSAGPERAMKSWAITKGTGQAEYWAQCGLQVLEEELSSYAQALHAVLAGSPETRPA